MYLVVSTRLHTAATLSLIHILCGGEKTENRMQHNLLHLDIKIEVVSSCPENGTQQDTHKAAVKWVLLVKCD